LPYTPHEISSLDFKRWKVDDCLKTPAKKSRRKRGNIPPPKGPNTHDQFKQEHATEDQSRNPQAVSDSVPFLVGVSLIALVQIDDDICEDAEEIAAHEAEDHVVLGGGREERLDLLLAELVRPYEVLGEDVRWFCDGS